MEDHGAHGLHRLQMHQGMPRWMRESYTFCSRCGAELRYGVVPDEERPRLICDSCGFIAYINPRMVVTTLPITAEGKVILLRRGIEPGYGAWAQPGGFLEIDETAIQGAVRETLEETGYLVEPHRIVGLYSRPPAGIVVVAFEARVVGGEARTGVEALEIRPFAPEEIPWGGIAFNTSSWALRDWVRGVRPELDLSAVAEPE